MKHLKLFESFKEEDIHTICREYGIKNYTINEDGSIDVVDGNTHLCFKKDLTKLPLKFRNVTSDFNCANNGLTSLEGCPKSVGGSFYCYSNQLTSLEDCPVSVSGSFSCRDNKITTFEHLPLSIGRDFRCSHNPIYNIWELFEDYSKIELFNYYDIIQDKYPLLNIYVIILDRLNIFLEEIGKKPVTEVKGYKCI